MHAPWFDYKLNSPQPEFLGESQKNGIFENPVIFCGCTQASCKNFSVSEMHYLKRFATNLFTEYRVLKIG